jgi:hypothetical protein
MKWIKGAKKGRKRELKARVFTVAFFRPFFASFFSDFIQYRTLDLDFLDLHPFCVLKLKRGKKPGEKRREYKKGRKKGAKKGGKKATVNNPNDGRSPLSLSLARFPSTSIFSSFHPFLLCVSCVVNLTLSLR